MKIILIFLAAIFAALFVHVSCAKVVQHCVKLTHAACQNAGYHNTAPFQDVMGKPYQDVKGKELTLYLGLLSSCSKTTSAAVLCALYFPRCEPHLSRPLLPCRSVCNEFVSKCGSQLNIAAQQGMLSAICELLPSYDGNPDTCFVPDGFNVSQASVGLNKTKCHRVGIPECQNHLHYNQTFFPTEAQNKSNYHLLSAIISTKCSQNVEKFTCFTRFPPCSKGAVQIPCKSICVEINTNCVGKFKQFSIPQNDCDFLYPDKAGTNGICTLTKWPAPWIAKPPPPPTKAPSCNKCTKITIKECANIGYSYTFPFKDVYVKDLGKTIPYQQHVATAIAPFLKLLTCSKYSANILCSMYLPKCDPYACTSLPILPCRSVCYEFVRKCDSFLSVAAMHGLMVALCDLLRVESSMAHPCLIPDGFKKTELDYKRDVCYPIKNPTKCQEDFSYNETFLTPSEQTLAQAHVLKPIIDSKCSSKAEKFFCYTRFPPCKREDQVTVTLPCRSMCEEVLGKCKDVFKKNNLPMADCKFLLPEGEGKDDLCEADVFPVAFRRKPPSPRPKTGKRKTNAGLIVGLVVLVVVVIAAAVVGGVLFHKKRKQQKPFEPQEFHNVEGTKA